MLREEEAEVPDVDATVAIRGAAGVTALLLLHLASRHRRCFWVAAAALVATALSRLTVIHRRSPRIVLAENYAINMNTTQQSVHGAAIVAAILLCGLLCRRIASNAAGRAALTLGVVCAIGVWLAQEPVAELIAARPDVRRAAGRARHGAKRLVSQGATRSLTL